MSASNSMSIFIAFEMHCKLHFSRVAMICDTTNDRIPVSQHRYQHWLLAWIFFLTSLKNEKLANVSFHGEVLLVTMNCALPTKLWPTTRNTHGRVPVHLSS